MTDPASDRAPAPAASPDFPVAWLEPADAESTWEWDDMHMPMAVAPLGADYVRTLASGFAYGYQRLEIRAEILVRVWNGWALAFGGLGRRSREPSLYARVSPLVRCLGFAVRIRCFMLVFHVEHAGTASRLAGLERVGACL